MIGRRSILGLIGLGSAGALSGATVGETSGMVAGANRAYSGALAGRAINAGSEDDGEYAAGQARAASWLRANGLPGYVRERIRRNVEVEVDRLPIPADIQALRSFAPHLKRRLHVERLARQHERAELDTRLHDLTRELRQSVIPEGVRNFMGWFG